MSVAHKIQPFTARSGDIVFREGDVSNGCMYFIFSGEVEISKQGLGHIRTLSQGHFFGEMALIRAIPRTASATVISAEAKLGKIDLQTFAWLAKNNPTFLTNLIGVVAKRSARAMKKVNDAYSAVAAAPQTFSAGDADV
ncbi:MAG: cyclic nucleotide-binding domain-containing protein [Turneriella sp.]